MPFGFKPKRNDSSSTTGSIDTSSPPDSPGFARKNPLSEPVTLDENKTAETQLESDHRNEQNEVANDTQEEELPIPPEFVDHYADVKVKWRKMDDEPLLYRDKYIAITKTYLYIFNYYIPDGKDKSIPMTSIKNIQTDKEANLSDMSYQKWGAGSIDLWWAKDLGRWKGHDLCIIVTVDHGWVKRKGFTLENIEGLYILKKAWKTANGEPFEE
ncbi:hypothetical protein RhiirA5_355897 [Rhizophagus irregularis]|uniref:Uncharacterized protein n=4 Tax=Rhizophagus irregularis TaxID=588596 RepID=A0A2I1ED17_9GLOM|nr:hypothetical protein GLOIN_2v1542160 [Rhizophagus irregularis DAOM 181602=DAOM 197198]EXX56937.1 hypothetical protein RirG_211670 [Rhizophagus irregularis DAOM 197198w]PKC10110.1 hypothetical protein RhiirA5_355897 [Rhizophagus irregularis]PKC66267.1 hypothetical protein RhiirA1_419521 [Rhizophagus irregularis]PKY20009.1 hypothetical protein RhiirB3_407706 [Rhizophagus irregularis]POG78123.1 hypothetical protein GLOIN_2v1542160 [Rhizophagus irregularis DAOM 181602=DAOM 197198]|eukprot:XP_025184989.1 hypothetical protein GLOIN_2v1542160 [Rhizophagus irregularis DAOM 181602=DAOM 197198]